MFRPAPILAVLACLIATPGPAATIQQDFDAAQALLDVGKPAEARNAFTALLTRFPPASRSKAASLVRARLGSALVATGDPDAAEPLLTAAIAGFTGAADGQERAVARWDLARAQESRGALDSAAETYRALVAAKPFPADSISDIAMRAALARTLIWSDPAEARQLLDALLALPANSFGTKSSEQRALLQTLRGRVDLNSGNAAEAKRWFNAAAKSAGGATNSRVNVADVRIRSDLVLANYKLGLMSEVQKYAALSGAGASESGSQALAARTPLPGCAPLTGLSSDAMAVVEFAIDDNGRVSGVTPIYATRGSGEPRSVARDDGPEVLFPQAVRRWFWRAEDVAKLDPFWRQAVRVELRCFNDRPDSDPVRRSFDAEETAWAEQLGVRSLPELPDNDAAALPLIRAELARRETADGLQSPQLLPVLVALASNDAASIAERREAVGRWKVLTRQFEPPLPVRTDFRLTEISWEADPIPTRAETLRFKRKQQTALLGEVEAAGQSDSRAAMLVRLRLGETLSEMRESSEARALFERIAASSDTVLPAGDPIRTSALLRISNMAAAAKDMTTAASALAATGLTPEQCSLIDIRPEGINNSIGQSAFSTEARRWANNGLVKVGFDITADGHTTNVRTIVASPPFIYSAATEKAISQFRYRPVFRPGNTLGCTGTIVPARFRVMG